MKIWMTLLANIFASNVYAQMQILPLPNNGAFAAVMPCVGEKLSVNSSVGVTNALQCGVDNGSSRCVFSINEQPLDTDSFKKWGFRFIEEVHKQYALQMDKNYKSIYQRIVDKNGIGNALNYHLVRSYNGMPISVKGSWMITKNRMLRGTVSCAPNGTNYMKSETEQFLVSFSIISRD